MAFKLAAASGAQLGICRVNDHAKGSGGFLRPPVSFPAPHLAVFGGPVSEGFFKSHIPAFLFTRQPLVPVNFRQFSLEFCVRGGRQSEVGHGGRGISAERHRAASVAWPQEGGFFPAEAESI